MEEVERIQGGREKEEQQDEKRQIAAAPYSPGGSDSGEEKEASSSSSSFSGRSWCRRWRWRTRRIWRVEEEMDERIKGKGGNQRRRRYKKRGREGGEGETVRWRRKGEK